MKAKVIVVTSGKGGVGKTTSTANIGAALARQGEKVAVIDVDVGLRNLDVVMGLESRVVFDLVDVLEGKCRLEQAMIKDKRVDGLFMLPASQTKDKDALKEDDLRRVVDELINERGFDRVLLDSPAGIEAGFRTAAAPAEGALVVVNPEVSSVRDADRIIGLLEARQIGEIKLIVTRVRPKMVASGNMLSEADILDILGIKPIGIIPEDEAILESTNMGEPAALGSSRAGQAYVDTARRMRGEDLPFPKLAEERSGFIAKVMRMFGGA